MTREVVERAKRYESDTVPGEFVTPADAVSGNAAGGEGELQEVRLPGLRLEHLEDRRRPPVRVRRDRDPAARRQGRPAARLPQQDGAAVQRRHRVERGQAAHLRLRPAQGKARKRRPRISPISSRSAPARNAPAASSSTAPRLYARSRSDRARAATSAPARSSQQPDRARADGQAADRGQDRALLGCIGAHRRKFSGLLVRGKDGKVGFEFEAIAPKAGAKPAAGKGDEAAGEDRRSSLRRAAASCGARRERVCTSRLASHRDLRRSQALLTPRRACRERRESRSQRSGFA